LVASAIIPKTMTLDIPEKNTQDSTSILQISELDTLLRASAHASNNDCKRNRDINVTNGKDMALPRTVKRNS